MHQVLLTIKEIVFPLELLIPKGIVSLIVSHKINPLAIKLSTLLDTIKETLSVWIQT
jgi:hypothetical protein